MLSIEDIKELLDIYATKMGVAYTKFEYQSDMDFEPHILLRHDLLGHVLGGGLPTTEGESVALIVELVFRLSAQFPGADLMWQKYKEMMNRCNSRTLNEWQLLGYPLTRHGFDEIYSYALLLLNNYQAIGIFPAELVDQFRKEFGIQPSEPNLIMGMKIAQTDGSVSEATASSILGSSTVKEMIPA